MKKINCELRLGIFISFLLLAVALPVLGVGTDIDYGLPIFGQEDIRLEKDKPPDFNLQLLKKYLMENQSRPLSQMHAINSLVKIIRLSSSPKDEELAKIAINFFRLDSFKDKPKADCLLWVYLKGLLLAEDKKADPTNIKDHEFEDILLMAEDKLNDMPEYWLAKGILFNFLKDRPNNYFAPMKPFEDLKRAIALTPTEPHHFFVLGQIFRLLGNQEPSLFFAVSCYEKAGSLAHANPKLHTTLLGIYMGLHENYQATGKSEPFWLQEAVYKKILLISPNNPHALNNLGFLYAEFGVHRETAQNLCQRAVDQISNNAGFRDSLGWAAFKNRQYEKAETELQKAVSLNPDTYEPLYHLGTLYYLTKQYDKAVAAYDKAIVIKPNSPEALNNYAYLLAELSKDLDKAFQMAVKATKLDPNNPSYIDTLAWVYFGKGEYSDALRYLKKALQMQPDVGEILLHIGKTYIQLGQFDAAMEHLKLAFKADPALDNIQEEIYLAVSLKAQYSALADYHKLFGAKVQISHLTSILLQLTRVFQEEGFFSKAIETTRLCEKLKRGEIDLSKPLFDFYTIDAATPSQQLTDSTSDQGKFSSETDKSDDNVEKILTMPKIAHSALALNIGPALTKIFAARLLTFDGFENISATIFINTISSPLNSAIFQIEFPELGSKDALKAVEYYLNFFGSTIEEPQTSDSEEKFLTTRFGKTKIWFVQKGNRLLWGPGLFPTKEDFKSIGDTFPYEENAFLGLLFDWSAWVSIFPKFVMPWLENPIGSFSVIYSRYWRVEGMLKEITHLVPTVPVDAKFMKTLAEQLFFYKTLMANLGIKMDLSVKANSDCVFIDAKYFGLPQIWDDYKQRCSWALTFFKPWIDSYKCLLRRTFFGARLSELAKVCPSGGEVYVNGPSGALDCSIHGECGFFPCIASSISRCEYSRNRLASIIKKTAQRILQSFSQEELIKKLLLEYNINSCPMGGIYKLEKDGSLSCSCHLRQPSLKQ